MLKVLDEAKDKRDSSWLNDLYKDFRKRLVFLLGLTVFREFDCKFSLNILSNNTYKPKSRGNIMKYKIINALKLVSLEVFFFYTLQKVTMLYLNSF